MRCFQGPVQKDVLESRFRTVFRARNFGGVFRGLVSGTDFRSAFLKCSFQKSGLRVLVFIERISRLEVLACRITFARGWRGTAHRRAMP